MHREMKKFFAFFIAGVVCLNCFGAMAANVTVKKSSSVKKQETSGLDSITGNSLLPGVIGLVSNVAALKKQSAELKAECIPTDPEIRWVNKMVKEYVKIGEKTATDMVGTSANKCSGSSWDSELQDSRPVGQEPCVPVFSSANNEIWVGYPEAKVGKYCPDLADRLCPESSKKTESNIYSVFGQISFDQEDYTEDEINMYVKLMEKAEKCAPEKISARNREAYTNFLKTTISGAGQSTNVNTATVWDAVGNLTNGSSVLQGVGNLAPSVIQLLDK